jgi:group II intron reverse transcriptase/maturase
MEPKMSRLSKDGEEVTSGALIRPASKLEMDNESERMVEASVDMIHLTNPEAGGAAVTAGGELVSSCHMETGEHIAQQSDVAVMSDCPIPHGVEFDPKTSKGNLLEPKNLTTTPSGVAEATSERCSKGRSLRSSPRTGKPSTWRREAVDTASRQEEGSSDPVNIGFILNMQRKLYRWSREAPDRVYKDLYNLVYDRRSLFLAWKKLSRNRGSRTPGIDGLTRSKVEAMPEGVMGFINKVQKQLQNGTYKPQPVRQRLISKPGKPGKYRPLGIPTLTDRLVQMALKNVLEPIFEADFYPRSYGFRRGRSTMDALTTLQHKLNPTHMGGVSKINYIIEADIKGCFDNIDHHLLMERLRRRIADRKVLRLVLAFLKAGIMTECGIKHPVAGTPQGGIISPLLANILLTGIDERYGKWSGFPGEDLTKACDRRSWDRKNKRPTFGCIRYADDFVILVEGTAGDAKLDKQRLSEYLQKQLHLELSQEKTLITKAEEGFIFLGYRVVKEKSQRTGKPVGKVYIPKDKLLMIRKRIKALTTRSSTGKSLCELLGKLNPIITGWSNYYRYATRATRDFNALDRWMWHRIYRWLRKKHRKSTSHTIRRKYSLNGSDWGEKGTLLKHFAQGPVPRFRRRGTRISNGWNDEIDNVYFYSEVTRPISGYTWLGELL